MLDRNDDGIVDRDDVAAMLSSLGAATPAEIPDVPPQTLPAFLSTLSNLLAPLSSRTELTNALAAFDDGDGGEIDVAELTEALLRTVPEPGGRALGPREVEAVMGGFVGRRAFGEVVRGGGVLGGGGGKGEVFRYREWVAGLMGGEEKKDGEK